MGERGMGDDRRLSHSQNFLRSGEFVGSLIDRTDIGRNDLVVEIGPGKGVITSELSKKAGKVLAVEVDGRLVRDLRVKFSNEGNVEIVQADFLKWDLPTSPYKVFANIPFNMTSDMVTRLLFSNNPPESAYLIMQDKAAGRFMGPPLGPISQMSTMLQPFYSMGVLTSIDRREFYPVPSVNTVLARFEKRDKPLVDDFHRQLYRDFVVYGYNQWKPTVLDSFKGVFTSMQLAIISKNLNVRGLKPSQLTVDQWVGMFDTFTKLVSPDKKDLVRGAEKRLRSKQSFMQKRHRTR